MEAPSDQVAEQPPELVLGLRLQPRPELEKGQ